MSILSMNKPQQSKLAASVQASGTADWALEPGQAITLTIGPGPRWVHVTQGRAWITQASSGTDHWLEQGDSLLVGDGAALVMEAWPSARFELLVPPQACTARLTLAQFWHRLAQSASGIWPRPLKSRHVQQRIATPRFKH
jgi:Protein of unknown function (DUF2917)